VADLLAAEGKGEFNVNTLGKVLRMKVTHEDLLLSYVETHVILLEGVLEEPAAEQNIA
jgi:hypothetical protein